MIYRKWFTNLSPISGKNLLILGIKYVFPYQGLTLPYQRLILPYQGLIISYQGLFFREVRDLETKKFADKYFLRISRLHLFIHNELAICRKMARLGDLKLWTCRPKAGL